MHPARKTKYTEYYRLESTGLGGHARSPLQTACYMVGELQKPFRILTVATVVELVWRCSMKLRKPKQTPFQDRFTEGEHLLPPPSLIPSRRGAPLWPPGGPFGGHARWSPHPALPSAQRPAPSGAPPWISKCRPYRAAPKRSRGAGRFSVGPPSHLS